MNMKDQPVKEAGGQASPSKDSHRSHHNINYLERFYAAHSCTF